VEDRVIRWALIALLGLAVAALVSLSASELTSQPVGLASEPLTAGDQLAPATAVRPAVTRPAPARRHRRTKPKTTTTKKSTPVTPVTPVTPPAAATQPPPPARTTTTATTDDHGGREHDADDRGGGDHDDD
jgi:hypothetical protein